MEQSLPFVPLLDGCAMIGMDWNVKAAFAALLLPLLLLQQLLLMIV